jgi:hypothetical protein
MKEKKVKLNIKGITPKQWGVLILELNLMKKAWRPYGVDIELLASGIKQIIEKGTRKYDPKNNDREIKY